MNNFVVGDQAQKKDFNIKPGIHENVSNKYYWRLVNEVGDDYIDLSKTDCDASSDIPEAGDEICQFGNRTDKDRQNAIVVSSYGPDSPSLKQYAGINSYSLVGKEVTSISPNNNIFTGKVTVKPGSSGYGNLTDKPDLDAISSTIKNAVAQNLGYTDFASMVAAASKGETIISNGIINTDLIISSVIITSQMIADAIQTNSLNVNDKFKVDKFGRVYMNECDVVGRLRSSNDGTRLEISPEDGTIYLYYDDGICGTLGWDIDGLNLNLIDKASKLIADIKPGRITLTSTATSVEENGSLTLDVRSMKGLLYADDNGVVHVKDEGLPPSPTLYYLVRLIASPTDSGTLTGGGRKRQGSTGTISATPAKGYLFSRWSDDNTEASRVIKMTEDLSLVACFTVKPAQETQWLADFGNNMNAKLTGVQSLYHSALLSPSREHVFDYANNEGFIMLERRVPNTSSAFIMSGSFVAYMQKSSDGSYKVWTANYPISANRYQVSVKVSTSTLNEMGIIATVNGMECTTKMYADTFYDVLTIDGTYKLILSTYDYNKGGKLISIKCGETQLNFIDKNLTWTGFPSTYGDIVFAPESITVDELIKQEQVDTI